MKTLLTLLITITISCAIDKSTYISKQKCNQVLEDGYISICYDYQNKSAKAVAYELSGNLVNSVNIKKRPRFYPETRVPTEHRAHYKDYTRSGFDRGHLASDASFDYSNESSHSVYTLANIVPQYPNLNRRSWAKVEKYEREIAVRLGQASVINIVKYSNNPQTIGLNKIAIPSGFYKVIQNKSKGFEECYYYENIKELVKNDEIINHKVGCESI